MMRKQLDEYIKALDAASTPDEHIAARNKVLVGIISLLDVTRTEVRNDKELARLQLAELTQKTDDTTQQVNNKLHALSNHVMGIELKIDELAELVGLLASAMGVDN